MGWFDSLFGDTDWGGVIAGGVTSMLGGRDQRRQAKDDWKQKLEALRMEFAGQRELAAQGRQWELEDRKFKADSVGNYAQFYSGPQVERAAPVDTTVTMRELPPELSGKAPATEAKPKKKRKKKKGGFLGKLFG